MHEVKGFEPAMGHKFAGAFDANFIVDLQKKFSDALGFLPNQALLSYIAAGRVLVGKENDQHAGYLLGRNAMRYDQRIAPITQAAVCMDLRRRGLGLRLVDDYCRMAELDGRSVVQCWCADDLDSRWFWPEAGFTAIARRWPGNTRGRSLTLWRKALHGRLLDDSMKTLPPLAGFKASKIGRIELIDGREDSRDTQAQLLLFIDCMQDDGHCFTG